MNLTPQNHRLRIAFVMVSALFVCGCQNSATTPPGPNSSSASHQGTNFTFLAWEEGLRVLFVDRMNNHMTRGSSSSDEPDHVQTGQAGDPDGTGYRWELRSSDGVTCSLSIDGRPYDVSRGAIFVMQTEAEGVGVHQLDISLEDLKSDREAVATFLDAHPSIGERLTESSAK